jgi:nucleoid-associated protein YgaU
MSKPEKALIFRLDQNFQEVKPGLEVQFNPTEFTFNKAAQFAETVIPGLDMPILQFVRGQTETLGLDLFFDSTDKGMGDDARPVTEQTDQFYQLIKIDRDAHAPSICRFVWGKPDFPGSKFTDKWSSQSRTNGFQCVVESVRQRFTLFSPTGTPLRAVLTVALKEYRTLQQQITQIAFRSADHTKSHTLQRGDTLDRIAAQTYGDSSQWRAIASANNVADPLQLQPGVTLTLPPITPRPLT